MSERVGACRACQVYPVCRVLIPWTSTGGPNHACMMVAVRVADFGCGGAAPPLEAAEPPLVWLAQRENLGV